MLWFETTGLQNYFLIKTFFMNLSASALELCCNKLVHIKHLIKKRIFFVFQSNIYCIDIDYDYVNYASVDEEILEISESNTVEQSQLITRKHFPETWLWNELANIRLLCIRFSYQTILSPLSWLQFLPLLVVLAL